MQNREPGIYRGKRLQLTGYVNTEDVNSWAGMWLRVDGKVIGKAVTTTVKRNGDTRKVTSSTHDKELKKTLAFDNMSNRALTGTTGWTRCEIVLDVADSATNIAFGVLLNGTGQLWFDDLKFDIVNTDVPTTGGRNKEPLNLDFEK